MNYSELETVARSAQGESAQCDFKGQFNPASKMDWCELIKDIVSMANSGGGCILFGLDDDGHPTGLDTAGILGYDPADITNKLLSYTGKHFADFRVGAIEKGGIHLACVMILGARVPLVFVKPGTYPESETKQRTAFSVGTVYFRHGAKSEPGTSDDLASFLEREIADVRDVWLGRLRQVVEAPTDAVFRIVPSESVRLDDSSGVAIRLTSDPAAPAYKLVDPNLTHPYRQKELLVKVNIALSGAMIVTSHHLLCVRRMHKIDTNPAYCYHGNFTSPTYSQIFVEWLIEQYQADTAFFEKCKLAMKSSGGVHDRNDERLQWTLEFMRKNGLSISAFAKLLKISGATLSRLLDGKYKGDVERMLQRIGAFRANAIGE